MIMVLAICEVAYYGHRTLTSWTPLAGSTTRYASCPASLAAADRARTQRWGDAPVHSIAVSLFQSKDQIHFFDEIGYEHNPYTHCPKDPGMWERGKCGCDPARSFGEYSLSSGITMR